MSRDLEHSPHYRWSIVAIYRRRAMSSPTFLGS